MRYEVYVNSLRGDKKILTSFGDVVSITKELESVVEKVNLNLVTFSDFLISFLKEKQPIFTSFTLGKSISVQCPNLAILLQIWISTIDKVLQAFLAMVNVSGEIQLTLAEMTFSEEVLADLVKKSINSYTCLKIEMPYLYRFIVFELFDAFKKNTDVKFEGVINNNLVVTDYQDRELVWEIDSTVVNYQREISKKFLSVL